jgi:hypothetical protein
VNPRKIAIELNAQYVKACGDSNLKVTIYIVPTRRRNADNLMNYAKYAAFRANLVWIVDKKMT